MCRIARQARRPLAGACLDPGRRHGDGPAGVGRLRLDLQCPGHAEAKHARIAGNGGGFRLEPSPHLGPVKRAPACDLGVASGEDHPEPAAALEHGGRDRLAPAEPQLQLTRTGLGRNLDAGTPIGPGDAGGLGRRCDGRRRPGCRGGLGHGARARDPGRPARPGGGLDRLRSARGNSHRSRRHRKQGNRHRDARELDDGEPGCGWVSRASTPGRRRRMSSVPPPNVVAWSSQGDRGVVTSGAGAVSGFSPRRRATPTPTASVTRVGSGQISTSRPVAAPTSAFRQHDPAAAGPARGSRGA